MKKVRNASYNNLKKDRTIGPCKEFVVNPSNISKMYRPLDLEEFEECFYNNLKMDRTMGPCK
jgi:hypothetical protein